MFTEKKSTIVKSVDPSLCLGSNSNNVFATEYMQRIIRHRCPIFAVYLHRFCLQRHHHRSVQRHKRRFSDYYRVLGSLEPTRWWLML